MRQRIWFRIPLLVGAAFAIVTAASGIASSLRHHEHAPTIGRVVFFDVSDPMRFAFYFTTTIALLITGILFALRAQNYSRGKNENRSGLTKQRVNALYRSLTMKTVNEDTYSGIMHGLIYWSFLTLTLVTVILEIDHQLPNDWRFLHGVVYEGYSFIGDLAGLLLLIGLGLAAYRRYLRPPPRIASKTRPEDAWILFLFTAIVITGFTTEASRISLVGKPAFEKWSFVGYALSSLWFQAHAHIWHQISWSTHAFLFSALLITLPVTKLRHSVVAPVNAYLSPRERPLGAAPDAPLLLEGEIETVGASAIPDFTWKQLLDTDACTVCGRCTEVCPANQTGKTLDPREIVLKVGAVMAKSGSPAVSPTVADPAYNVSTDQVTQLISAEEVFACTTCRACDDICPVEIEIMDKIIDIRRHYTLMESEFPSELGTAFVAMENSGNPWGMDQNQRASWTNQLDFKVEIVDGTKPFSHEYLYWVGCAGSFDDRNRKVTLAVANLLHTAGVDFAIFGPNENCTGDPARRSGNEYLFQMLATQNIALLNGVGVQKIITQCPHCFTTLANDYQPFGGHYEVVHHSELLASLLAEQKLPVSNTASGSIVFHDSCYLGRQNNIYDAPRRVVGSLKGISVLEANPSGENGMCCGAGGAQFWMEETQGTRINEKRAQQLLDTGADQVATACPFCAVMLNDAMAANGSQTEVNDIAVLLWDAVNSN